MELSVAALVEKGNVANTVDESQDITMLTPVPAWVGACLQATAVCEIHEESGQTLVAILMDVVVWVQLKFDPQIKREDEPKRR